MRSVLLVSLLASAAAFSPAVLAPRQAGSSVARSALRSMPSPRAAARRGGALRMVSFPFGKKEPPKERFGGESPYRTFGVAEDAPYEEVEKAYKELCAEHEGEDKYLIKLEMMKEAIFDDRLKARMSGALQAKVRDSPFEKKLIVYKEPWYAKIAWLSKIVVMPTRKYAVKASILMGCFIMAGLFAPQLSATTMGFGFLSSMGFLYNRGTPEMKRDDEGNPGEARPANYGALGKAIGLLSIFGGAGFAFAQVVVQNTRLPPFIAADSVVNAIFNLFLLATALVFQVQEEQ